MTRFGFAPNLPALHAITVFLAALAGKYWKRCFRRATATLPGRFSENATGRSLLRLLDFISGRFDSSVSDIESRPIRFVLSSLNNTLRVRFPRRRNIF